MGKKIMDKKTRRGPSRGRKSKAGGGKKSKATQEYTPLQKEENKIRRDKLILFHYFVISLTERLKYVSQ